MSVLSRLRESLIVPYIKGVSEGCLSIETVGLQMFRGSYDAVKCDSAGCSAIRC